MATPQERLRIFIRGCLVGYAVIIAGFLGIKIGVHAAATRKEALIVALRAAGGGGGTRWDHNMSGSYGESPVVRYTIPGAAKAVENDNVGFFDGPYTIGDSVEIFYYPWEKENAKLYNFSNYWFNISTFMILVIVFMAWTGINNLLNMKEGEEIEIPIDPIP